MLIIGSILLLLHQVQGDCSNENKFTSSWGTGANGAFSFKVPESTSTGWTIQVTFDKPVTNLNVWNGQNEQCNGNVCTFSNKNWNKRQNAGSILNLGYGIGFASLPQVTALSFNGHGICGGAAPPPPPPVTTTVAPVTTTVAPVTTTVAPVTTTSGSGGGSGSCESTVTMTSTWSTGATGSLHVTFPKTVSSWKIEITFSSPVTSLTVWDGSNVQCSGNVCSFENLGWNAQQSAGNKAKIDFMLAFASLPNVEKVTLDGADLCSGSGGPPPPVTTTTNAPGPVTTTATVAPPPPVTTTEAPPGPTTTAAPPGTTTTMKPSCGKKVVCYYPNWAFWRTGSGKFTVDNIDSTICTHLIYAFVALDPITHTIKVFDQWLDINLKNFEKFTNLKSVNPNLKVLVALGGWTDSQANAGAYKTLFATPSLRTKFIQDAKNFLKTHNFDGIDLDYEFPVAGDKDNFGLFVKELREGLGDEYELTAATSATPSKIAAGYPISIMNQYLDAWHLMSYDMHGSWEGLADHHAPLYSRPWDVSKRDIGDTGSPNVDKSVQWLISQGVAKDKIVVGMPTYGRSFTVPSGSDMKPPISPASAGSKGPITGEAGFLGYLEICLGIKNGEWTGVADKNGPYAYKGNQWVGYDTIDYVKEKAKYILDNELGGAMFWDLSTDDFNNQCGDGKYPLIGSVNNVLNGGC